MERANIEGSKITWLWTFGRHKPFIRGVTFLAEPLRIYILMIGRATIEGSKIAELRALGCQHLRFLRLTVRKSRHWINKKHSRFLRLFPISGWPIQYFGLLRLNAKKSRQRRINTSSWTPALVRIARPCVHRSNWIYLCAREQGGGEQGADPGRERERERERDAQRCAGALLGVEACQLQAQQGPIENPQTRTLPGSAPERGRGAGKEDPKTTHVIPKKFAPDVGDSSLGGGG